MLRRIRALRAAKKQNSAPVGLRLTDDMEREWIKSKFHRSV